MACNIIYDIDCVINRCDFTSRDNKTCEKIKYGRSNYCQIHKCHFDDSCKNQVNKISLNDYPMLCIDHISHKCKLSVCDNIKEAHKLYCDLHNCQYPRCNSKVIDIVIEYTQIPNIDKYYCENH